MSARRPGSGGRAGKRLEGIDLARGAALLAMMAAHVLPVFEQTGPAGAWEATWAGTVFSGRAAALFAVLAGVSLTLGRTPAARNRLGLVLRAAVIAAVGFTLGLVEVNVAVILVQYAVLFAASAAVVGLGQRALGLLAASWLLLSPIVAFAVRAPLLAAVPPLRLEHSPRWEDLLTPAALAADIAVTGFYPVLQWFGYVLVGLWIGRAQLARASVQTALLVGGTAAAALAKGAEWALLYPLGGINALLATQQARVWPLQAMLEASLAGVEQTETWWWLATAAPHSGTTLDLVHTSGVAAAAIGAFLLLARLRPLAQTRLLSPLSGAGATTLTLYTAHVAALGWSEGGGTPGLSREALLAAHIVAALAIGLFVRSNGWRGPLEALAHGASRLGALAGSRGKVPSPRPE
ncbi:heparan-alpha-glucosaminide N-acetyltransferase domain-containing protein [Sinomonas halotolerans]